MYIIIYYITLYFYNATDTFTFSYWIFVLKHENYYCTDQPVLESSMEDLEKAFAKLDPYNRNSIGFQQLKSYINDNYYYITDDNIRAMVNNTSDQISFDEFQAIVINIQSMELEDTFKLYDKDKDGKINKEELYATIKSFDNEIQEYQVSSIIEKYDNDGDGCINFDEFKSMISDGKNAFNWYVLILSLIILLFEISL